MKYIVPESVFGNFFQKKGTDYSHTSHIAPFFWSLHASDIIDQLVFTTLPPFFLSAYVVSCLNNGFLNWYWFEGLYPMPNWPTAPQKNLQNRHGWWHEKACRLHTIIAQELMKLPYFVFSKGVMNFCPHSPSLFLESITFYLHSYLSLGLIARDY